MKKFYLLGLLGHPVKHSLSPPMHRAALQFFGLDGDYRLIDVEPERLPNQLASLIEQGFIGWNVTIPHKERMFAFAQNHTRAAQRSGAANTIKLSEHGSQADNTDVIGFTKSVEQDLGNIKRETAVLLGAGGAARAVLVALCDLNFERVVIGARDLHKASQMVASVSASSNHRVGETKIQFVDLVANGESDQSQSFPLSSLLINATPLGLASKPLEPALPHWFHQALTALSKDGLFFDLVYSRSSKDTPMVEAAKASGLRAIDGTDMLVHQARYAFQFWTEHLPPYEIMRAAFDSAKNQ